MTNLVQLFIFFTMAGVQCDNAFHQRLPYIEMIPTSVNPQICVTAREELPPCGIGKFRQNQREYEARINKIRESYVDMIIDYKSTKNGSVENYGPGKIYLESFESLDRQMEEEERQTNLTKVNESESEFKVEQSTTEASDFRKKGTIEPSIIRIVRVVRSLEKTIIVANECIPLGVEFCDDFPRRPRPAAYEEFKKIQKRSLGSFPEYLRYLWSSQSKYISHHKPKSITDNLVEIYPVNREDFFKRVDKRSISDEFNSVENAVKKYKLMDFLSGGKVKSIESYDTIDDFRKIFGVKNYEEVD